MSQDVNTVESFFGVYLLFCKNPKYFGRTYIGYTVDPNRRIKQHNKGRKYGGAWKTSNRGPWSMVMIIHGFPNDIAALRFEWAWQHPQKSRRLNHIPKKKPREKTYEFCLRILSEMLRVGPWNRLPLTIRWLDQEFQRDFPIDKLPPIHMPIIQGNVISKKLPKSNPPTSSTSSTSICYICKSPISDRPMSCLEPSCTLTSHIICLSRSFLTPGEYVPIDGQCPKCGGNFLWGDLVRKLNGCYSDITGLSSEIGEDFYPSDEGE